MLNTVFYLMLAGCAETSTACQAIPAPETAFVTADACDDALLSHLMEPDPKWPVIHAICVPGEVGGAAVAPTSWPVETTETQLAKG